MNTPFSQGQDPVQGGHGVQDGHIGWGGQGGQGSKGGQGGKDSQGGSSAWSESVPYCPFFQNSKVAFSDSLSLQRQA